MQHDDYYNFFESDCESKPIGTSQRGEVDNAHSIMVQYLIDSQLDPFMLEKYPPIEGIFREFNTAPPSNAQVEGLFCKATMTKAPKNDRITDEKFEQRVVL